MRRAWAGLGHNFGLKVISGLLALSLFGWRAAESNPNVEKTFTVPSVKATGLRNGLLVVTKPPAVTIVVRGPRRLLETLAQGRKVQPEVDCSAITEPTWTTLRIGVPLPDGVERRSVEPPEWLVELDVHETDTKPVRAEVGASAPAVGFVGDAPRLAREQAEVRGPRKLVSRVAYLRAEVDLGGLRADARGQARLVPTDGNGLRVGGVECVPATAGYEVRIRRAAGQRNLPVTAPQIGQPAPGWRVGQVVCEPARVVASGTADGLRNQGDAVSTKPLEVDGRRESFEVRLPLVPVAGVATRPAAVLVRVTMERTRKHGSG